jgi:hypothetical protein
LQELALIYICSLCLSLPPVWETWDHIISNLCLLTLLWSVKLILQKLDLRCIKLDCWSATAC